MFQEKGDRRNRQRLREFTGFEFADGSDEYEALRAFAAANLTLGDLTAICGILGLDYDGTTEQLIGRILEGLTDLN